MKNVLSRFSAVGVAMLILIAVRGEVSAQSASEIASARPASPEDLSQAELLKAYLQLRDQLHATQLAIMNNRAEAEATARAHAAALAEKLESMRSAYEAERERQRAEREHQRDERERQQSDREREQMETQRSNRMVLWIATAFGGTGVLALLLMPLFQIRAINRMAELAASHTQLAAPSHPRSLLPADVAAPSDQAVAASSQRLLSVIDRMERRIMELEETAATPLPLPTNKSSKTNSTPAVVSVTSSTEAKAPAEHEASRHSAAANGQATWIAVLMNKARSLLGSNKALEAVACYDEVLKFDPKHGEALVKKGAALERLERFEEAIECYEHAMDANRKMTLAYLRKGAVCNRLGRHEEAVKCFEQAMQVEERGLRPAIHV